MRLGIELAPLASVEPSAVEHLLDRAFGPDRHARTAYRLREGITPIASLSLAARDGDRLVGSIQCWPVELRCDAGGVTPMVMVGPVAVAPESQQGGIGRLLMAEMLAAAATAADPGAGALMLVGDPEYYARFFGFAADHTGRWRLPGPFDPRRLLARGSAVPDCAGMVGPRTAPSA